MTRTDSERLGLPRSYRPLSVADGIRAAMRRDPGKIAITCGERDRSYEALVDRIDRITSLIGDIAALGEGSHGAILAPNCLEYLEIVVGAAQAGIPLATINPRLSTGEITAICDDAQARVLFTDPASAEAIADCPFETVSEVIVIGDDLDGRLARAKPRIPDHLVPEWEVFTIPYTSGTTGRPKGVMVSHRSRILTLFGMAAEYGCFSPDDRFLAFAPLCHGAGMVFGLAPIFFGGHVEILPRFDPEFVLARLQDGAMTGVFMVPTHFHGIFGLEESLLRDFDGSRLRTIISNAAPLPQVTKERAVEFFGDGLLHETYGSTEGGIVTNLRPRDQLRKERCVGQPFVSTQVRLLNDEGRACEPGEIGELYSLSPYLFNGYWQNPDETEAAFRDGWVSVGDMARQDEEGYIYIVDRKTDMVISGGMNIYPREIEEVLVQHPAIAEAAVVGLPDERWGERLKAFLVVRDESGVTQADIEEFCDGRIARYKIPREVELIDELPRNAAGKVLKTELRGA